MAAALDCASRGRGAVEPNPMVGAVIVREGVEFARGWHREFGRPHAEIEAIGAARAAGADLRGATLYVTLEPCCHLNKKTPPCTETIIPAGFARVVVAMEDPDENVRGRGIAALRAAGISVDVGVCEQAARELLAAYVKLRTRHRPWVICKWAQTADGFLALPRGKGRWISSEQSRARVHELRGLCDGVLVGAGTVLADDPLLTNRSGKGRQPPRVVLDGRLRMPLDCQLVRTAGDSPVILATTPAGKAANPAKAQELVRAGVEVLEIPEMPGDGGAAEPAAPRVGLDGLLDELGRRQWTYLLVEGGAEVLDSFVTSGLADELIVFISPERLGAAGAKGMANLDIARVGEKMSLKEEERRSFGPDTMLRYLIKR